MLDSEVFLQNFTQTELLNFFRDRLRDLKKGFQELKFDPLMRSKLGDTQCQ